jgi:hypothetical protein
MTRWGAVAALLLAAGHASGDPLPADPAVTTEPQTAPAVAPPTPPAAPAAEPNTVPPRNLEPLDHGRVINVLGRKVSGPAAEDLGVVVDLLVDESGKPKAAIIDFGGFLGVGSRKIAVDWTLLQFRPADTKAPILLNLDRAELQAAPEYKEAQPSNAMVGLPPSDPPPGPPEDHGAAAPDARP